MKSPSEIIAVNILRNDPSLHGLNYEVLIFMLDFLSKGDDEVLIKAYEDAKYEWDL